MQLTPPPDFRPALRILPPGLLLLVLLVLSGCTLKGSINYIFGPNHVMEGLDPEVSFNVLSPPWWWPDEDTFLPKDSPVGQSKKDYYDEHGAPDFIRVWYSNEGVPLARATVTSRQGLPEPKGTSWIYRERQVEVFFGKNGSSEKPLNDEVSTICEFGDPDEVRFLGNDPNVRYVRYIYRRPGLIIDFQNFKQIELQRVRELPGWMRS